MTNGINEVTFPVKGSVTTKREGKADKVDYRIWALDGRSNLNDTSDVDNLVEV